MKYFWLCLFLIGITISGFAADLIGYWPFDDGAGKTAADLSGNGNDGTLQGNPKWTDGIKGGALDFNRDNQDYVEIANADAINPAKQFTISAWIKPRSVYKGGEWQFRNSIVAKRVAYYFDIDDTGHLACTFYPPNGNHVGWVSGKTDMESCVDKWVNVVACFDGENVCIYLDGELEAKEAKSANGVRQNTESLYIGYVDNNRYFDGLIDEVKLWDAALSSSEIKTEMMETKSVSAKGKLATCWAEIKFRIAD